MIVQAHQRTVAQCTEVLEKHKAEYQKLLLVAKEKDKQMTAAEAAIAKRKTQLQEAKSNKEFQALQVQIKADEVANSVLADETLEAMEKAEKYMPNIAAAEVELRKAAEQLEGGKKTFALEEPVIQADVERVNAELRTYEKRLPRDFVELYARLVKHLGGPESLAVVVKNKFCGGCNQQIPINALAQILEEKPITCGSCGRLLFVPEDFKFGRG